MQLIRKKAHKSAAKGERVTLFDVRVDFDGKKVTFEPKGSVYAQEYKHSSISKDIERAQAARKSKKPLEIKKVACGTSSSIIVELPDRTQYLVLMLKDSKAVKYPNKLATPSGLINTKDPLESVVKKMVGEAAMFANDSIIVPKYTKGTFSKYNHIIERDLSNMAHILGIKKTTFKEADEARLATAFKFNGNEEVNADLSLCTFKEGDSDMLDLILPPLVVKHNSLGSFRDMPALQSKSKYPERDILLLKIRTGGKTMPGVIVYRDGTKIRRYKDIKAYAESNFIDPAILDPSAASLLESMGLHKKVLEEEMYYAPLSALAR